MMLEEIHVQTQDGTGLSFRVFRTPTPPVAIVGIVHGLGEHSGRYLPVVESLNEQSIVVVTFDHRGHGRTGGPLPSFSTLLSDLQHLVESMKQVSSGPRFLYGQSLGGALALHYAIKNSNSLDGVIASSPLLRTTHRPPPWKVLLGKLLFSMWPTFSLPSGIQATDLTRDEAEVKRFLSDPLIHHRISAALGISMLDAGEWALQHADSISVPLLLMHGSEDQVTSCKASQAFAERAGSLCSFRLWQGGHHELHFDTIRADVLQFAIDWILKASDQKK